MTPRERADKITGDDFFKWTEAPVGCGIVVRQAALSMMIEEAITSALAAQREEMERTAAAGRVTPEMVERAKANVRKAMPERFGSPEALADPVRTARWEKSSDEMAEKYARAALTAALTHTGDQE